MYRFLLTPRWLGAAVLAIAAALVMVRLGEWQLHRYEERHAINTRIDAADSTRAAPLTSVVSPPSAAGKAGPAPGNSVAWTKVTFTGQYDPAHEIQARGRTVDGDVGFEIVTPLRLSDGSGVLVDRGWVPAPDAGALAAPTVPPAPTGQVTVVGQIHLSESRPTPIEHRDGRLDTRRISVPRLAGQMPFPVYGAYILLTDQTPANDKAFSQIPIDHEDDWQNAGYTVQWWLFACMTLYAYVYYARKEKQLRADARANGAASSPPTGDRVDEADRDLAAARSTAQADHAQKAAPTGSPLADHAQEAAPTGSAQAQHAQEAARTGSAQAAGGAQPGAKGAAAQRAGAKEADAQGRGVEAAAAQRPDAEAAAARRHDVEAAAAQGHDAETAAAQRPDAEAAAARRHDAEAAGARVAGSVGGVEADGRVQTTAGQPAAVPGGRVGTKERAERRRAEKEERKRAGREEAERKRAEKIERIRAEAMRKAPVDRVEEADRKRAEAEAKRKLAAQSGQD